MTAFKARHFSSLYFILPFLLLGAYGVLIFLIFQRQYPSDFPSFYSSAQSLLMGEDPYQNLIADYLPIVKKLSANLNPPILLVLLSPLVQLNYFNALLLWLILSFVVGFIGFYFSVLFSFPKQFIKKNKLNLYLLYFAFFPVLMNTMAGQFGTFILFFIMTGYYFYNKKNDYLSGIFWGLIIGIKIFPAFLFFFVLVERRYRTASIMFLTCLASIFIPFLIYGETVYHQYFSMLPKVLWFGDNWNASIYGFIFRLFINPQYQIAHPILLKGLYGASLIIISLWYLRKTTISITQVQDISSWNKTSFQIEQPSNENKNHQPFCLALVLMLLMSPLGWMYYFPLLFFPLFLSWAKIFSKNDLKPQLLWLVVFFFLNFPIDYFPTKDMLSSLSKFGFHSFYFYGLLILAYLLAKNSELRKPAIIPEHAKPHFFSLAIILGFGLIIPILSILIQFLDIEPTF